jgi:hypothetical protein
MLTTYRLTATYEIREEYLGAEYRWESFGLEALDAPERIASGSHYSYEYCSMPGRYTSMPSAVDRVQ